MVAKEGTDWETALIAAIISDTHMKSIYEQLGQGYFAALELVVNTAFYFYDEFQEQLSNPATDWCEESEKHGASSYDELVIKWSANHIEKLHHIKLSDAD